MSEEISVRNNKDITENLRVLSKVWCSRLYIWQNGNMQRGLFWWVINYYFCLKTWLTDACENIHNCQVTHWNNSTLRFIEKLADWNKHMYVHFSVSSFKILVLQEIIYKTSFCLPPVLETRTYILEISWNYFSVVTLFILINRKW